MYKKLVEGKKAVIFDLDGTLINSVELWENSFYKIYKINKPQTFVEAVPTGISLPDHWDYVLKRTEFETKHTVKELVEQTEQEFIKVFSENNIDLTNGFWPLAVELKENKGFKLGLVTNTSKSVTEKVLEKFTLGPVFDAVVTRDDVKKPKPNPEMYKKAAKMLGAAPSQILVFEDSVTGAKAAKNAGMDVLIVWDGSVPENKYPKGMKGFVVDFEGLDRAFSVEFWEGIRNYAQSLLEEERDQSEGEENKDQSTDEDKKDQGS
jgi:HAD superfamily hydrolase (TIGR01509 family)